MMMTMKFQITFLFHLCCVSFITAAPVPAIGWIGSSIHLLYGLDPFGSIVNHVYSGQKTSDGQYDISDIVIDVPVSRCSYSSSSFTTDSFEEYKTESTSNLKISGEYKKFTGAYSQETESIKQNIYKNKKFVSRISADCVQYELNMIRRGVPLKSWFINDAKHLPNTIDLEENLLEYFDFFDYYGTHIINGCQVGGKLIQDSFTDETYFQLYSKDKITQQAEAKFFISVDGSRSETRTIDTKYTQNTVTNDIKVIGGEWPDSIDNWNPWIQSVQDLNNVGCINWSARDITDVFQWSSELKQLHGVAEAALSQYFNLIGCTIPTAINYNRNALTMNGQDLCDYKTIPEFRICFQEIEGSSQCQGTRSSCSDWSTQASVEDLSTWTSGFRDDTDNRGGGCKYQWKLEQRDSQYTLKDKFAYKYRICFTEKEGSSQCQNSRSSCSGWNGADSWTAQFRDDTDNRGGGCRYYWMIEQQEDAYAPTINECRICFQETEGSSQCQGSRFTCTGWSKSAPAWTAWFRDDTDNRGGGCKYQWKMQCR